MPFSLSTYRLLHLQLAVLLPLPCPLQLHVPKSCTVRGIPLSRLVSGRWIPRSLIAEIGPQGFERSVYHERHNVGNEITPSASADFVLPLICACLHAVAVSRTHASRGGPGHSGRVSILRTTPIDTAALAMAPDICAYSRKSGRSVVMPIDELLQALSIALVGCVLCL